MQIIHRSTDQPQPFTDPLRTLDGKPRARVPLRALDTLWFNTGTLCNLTCENCYIESSPTNDALQYLTLEEVETYLAEIDALALPVRTIGFTGGEPFMNPAFMAMLAASLEAGHEVLVLTNGMRPMLKVASRLEALRVRHGSRLVLRVSVDHHDRRLHEEERGRQSWTPMLRGLKWLSDRGFVLHVAGRTRWGDDEGALRDGFAALFDAEQIRVDARDPGQLILFPEMDPRAQVPEISTACWALLGKRPDDLMCATSRMVVHRRGAEVPAVLACTLLPYDARFEFGARLADALGEVTLNHVHCARFCVLGGGSCSG
jgi:uncharacterized Fe-S cluster-containing radical SAM superfamily protein